MKISLITATYNSEKTLRDTFEGLLMQTYTNYEYIVKDGGSTDRTIEIIKQYESRFEGKMHWVSERDKGLYDAINTGIKMSNGDIVGIINSDDFYHRNNSLEIVASTFEKNPTIDACYADMRYVNPDDLTKTVRYYSSKGFRPSKFRYGYMPGHPTFFTYKKYFNEFGFYKTDYKIAADYELLIRFLYTHNLKTKYLPVDLLKMRTGGISTSGLKSTILLNKEIEKACRENGIMTNQFVLYLRYLDKIKEFIFKHGKTD